MSHHFPVDPDPPILHHYDFSPFSEKVRLIFGLKQLRWCSVVTPAVMPKPELVALTGGYRHIPVLQIALQPHLGTAHHYALGRALAPLREEGVLILGSGGATHNLRQLGAPDAAPPAWASDFSGWQQDLTLYMPRTFDPQYIPSLEVNDPGEPPNRGALLVAPLGKGTYVYTTLAFFRQLPNGVPGAARLFVNLMAAKAPRSVQ